MDSMEHVLAKQQDLPDSLKEKLGTLLPDILDLAIEAGKVILEVYKTDFHIENKKDNTPVTTADFAANEFIVNKLTKLTPDIPILSEESDEIPFEKRSTWTLYWLVDPLDGTRTFIEKTGEFSVNIALIYQHSPILGVIYSPIKECTFYAYQGLGAFYQHNTKPAHPIRVCSKIPKDQSRKVKVACTQSSHCQALAIFLDNLKKELYDYELKYMGSSLKSCMVAEGEADIYARLGPTSEWDTAAAQCIVEEAGGLITDTNMQVLRYNTKDSLLNPNFFVFGDRSIAWQRLLLKE